MTLNKDTQQTYKTRSLIALIVIVTGVSLMMYMIVVEDEPGGIPLILIVSGTLLYLYYKKMKGNKPGLKENTL